MDTFEKLYAQHKSEIIIGRKSANALIDSLREIIDLELEDQSIILTSHLNRMKSNIAYGNDTKNIDLSDLIFQLYSVLPNEKSKKYYQDYIPWPHAEDKVLILLEMNTGEFQTNCNLLVNDLGVLRGISLEDFKQRDLAFKSYLLYFWNFVDEI